MNPDINGIAKFSRFATIMRLPPLVAVPAPLRALSVVPELLIIPEVGEDKRVLVMLGGSHSTVELAVVVKTGAGVVEAVL